jgi:hypothetical protein
MLSEEFFLKEMNGAIPKTYALSLGNYGSELPRFFMLPLTFR